MFTGIIEEIGTLKSITPMGDSIRLSIGCKKILDDFQTGDSISVSGCCLTAETIDSSGFTAFATPETMKKTALGDRKIGDGVNLERALTLSTRLGGHLVSGHVDATGTFKSAKRHGEAIEVWIEAPGEIISQSINKGSIATDGISLTIVELTDSAFSIWVIPETWERTTLSQRQPGERINLESDLIGKYVYRFLEIQPDPKKSIEKQNETLKNMLAQGGWGTR
jgi:riboflavin synthase